jgi:2-dehydropantoate 2-reductase
VRILSIGAGAIGTYIGGSLALDGHEVVFVERPEMARALRDDGLRLTIDGVDHAVPGPRVAESLAEALSGEPFDVALFALKSFDTAGFLASLGVPAAAMPPVLCLSNGVDNEPTLAAALGSGKVLAGTVTSAIGRAGDGAVVLERRRGVGVATPDPREDAGLAPLCDALVAAMDAAGLHARRFASADAMKWSKLLTNLIANATSAILDLTPAAIFAHPALYRLEREQLLETLRVMDARGIDVVDLPGTPVRMLARVIRWLPAGLSRPLLGRAVGSGRGAKMPSFHIDLHAGRERSEVDFLNGAVVRAGQDVGVPTPVNTLLTRTLLAMTCGEVSLDTYRGRPARLLTELSR